MSFVTLFATKKDEYALLRGKGINLIPPIAFALSNILHEKAPRIYSFIPIAFLNSALEGWAEKGNI